MKVTKLKPSELAALRAMADGCKTVLEIAQACEVSRQSGYLFVNGFLEFGFIQVTGKVRTHRVCAATSLYSLTAQGREMLRRANAGEVLVLDGRSAQHRPYRCRRSKQGISASEAVAED